MKERSSSNRSDNASTHEVRVLYADTDQMGVVYHATYLRWFEAGRAHYMRVRGRSYADLERSAVQLPVVEAQLRYLRPARYDDVLQVHAWVEELGRAQVCFGYSICRDGQELVRGTTRHAAIRPEGRLTRLPDDIKQALSGPETSAPD